MTSSAAARPRVPRYQSAIDLFEAARDAASDKEKSARKLEKLEARKGSEAVRAQSYEATGRGGGGDPTARTDARLDLEEICRRRIEDDKALISLADEIVYGRERHAGGVELLVSADHADVLHFYFCEAMPWRAVADMVGMSESWCRSAAQEAIDHVDAYGIGRMLDGHGMAS